MTTHLTWRAAQAWLAGYSDALDAGSDPMRTTWDDAGYVEDYDRGYAIGEHRAELRAAA